MRIRLLAILAAATIAPHPAAAADLTLSPNFLRFATYYLHTARDCSYRAISNNPIPCAYEDISEQTRAAATTQGDLQLVDNFDSWIVAVVLYSRAASAANPDPQKLAQRLDAVKHASDLCSAELTKALDDKTAPDKSPCNDALNVLNAQ